MPHFRVVFWLCLTRQGDRRQCYVQASMCTMLGRVALLSLMPFSSIANKKIHFTPPSTRVLKPARQIDKRNLLIGIAPDLEPNR